MTRKRATKTQIGRKREDMEEVGAVPITQTEEEAATSAMVEVITKTNKNPKKTKLSKNNKCHGCAWDVQAQRFGLVVAKALEIQRSRGQ